MSKVKITPIDAKQFPEFDNHKKVVQIEDSETGLFGFISIHNTNRGPAIGGSRYCFYENKDFGLKDSLRLSRAMTYKCAIADVPYGGGKGVLIAPSPNAPKTDAYLASYAEILGQLGERFFTGEDVGLAEHDVRVLADHCDCIVGKPEVGGLPAKWAALSVFYAMEAALEHRFASPSFEGKTVAIKGLGGVGIDLCVLLENAGANIIGADTNPVRVTLAQKNHKSIRIVETDSIHTAEADVYAPCALGDEFNSNTIPQLRARIVCGAANNQLSTKVDGKLLFEKGILYIPDYVANAGGLISVADELHEGGYSQERVKNNIFGIKKTVGEIIETSTSENKPTNEVADELAERRFLHKK